MISFETKWLEAKNKVWEIFQKHNGNIALAYSGGKDSSVLLELVRQVERERERKILIVSSDTGIELKTIAKRMYDTADVIVKPKKKYGQLCLEFGKPFKSKMYDEMCKRVQMNIVDPVTREVLRKSDGVTQHKTATDFLQKKNVFWNLKDSHYNLIVDQQIKINNKCCDVLKKDPMNEWTKENKIGCMVLGLRMGEGGSRGFVLKNKGCYYGSKYHMILAPMKDFTDDDIEEAIVKFNIEIDIAYKYFNRTGCWTCPYALNGGKKKAAKYLQAMQDYDQEVGTNYLEAFKVLNKERIKVDKIEMQDQQLRLKL